MFSCCRCIATTLNSGLCTKVCISGYLKLIQLIVVSFEQMQPFKLFKIVIVHTHMQIRLRHIDKRIDMCKKNDNIETNGFVFYFDFNQAHTKRRTIHHGTHFFFSPVRMHPKVNVNTSYIATDEYVCSMWKIIHSGN